VTSSVERRSAISVSKRIAVTALEDSYLVHVMKNSIYFGSAQQSSLDSTLALFNDEVFLEPVY
jgi:hypothetical protein